MLIQCLLAIKLPAFTAGIVLLLSIWGVKRSGVSIDPAKEMEDVYKCMQVLKDAETRCVMCINRSLAHV